MWRMNIFIQVNVFYRWRITPLSNQKVEGDLQFCIAKGESESTKNITWFSFPLSSGKYVKYFPVLLCKDYILL